SRRMASCLVASALTLAAPVARAEFPTLDVAIQRARTQAIVVADAEAEVGAARGQLAGARVSALGNPYTEVQVDRPFSNYDAAGRNVQAMTFTYFPIDIAGQRGKRVEEAERLVEWKKLGLVDARAIATADVVAAYGEYTISTSRVIEAETGETSAREEAKYFQGRFEAKDTTLYEKSIAEAEVARWVQSRAEAELRVANTRARFGQLTGIPDPDRPPPSGSLLPPTLRASWDDAHVARVIDKSPLVSRVAAEKTYWDASIERYEREKMPPVSFEVIAGRGGSGEARLGGGAVITLPVTRRYQGEIARAEAGRSNASRRLELYRGVINARVRAARDAIRSTTKAIEELDKNGIPALERAVSASVEGFRAGKIDLTRAMLARRDLAIARARRLDLLEAAWRAYADLIIFTGDLP
ncbi:MAG: Heavy metal efflux outer membrane protein CzcC family, partial [Labilithrix sp.]|nr:Heavy metal efflux outer membrane protein CzcC family [Labilithrix sp.]